MGSIQDLTVLDTQGIESRWPGIEFSSTRAAKGDVVEPYSRFIVHVALKRLPICVDCEHRSRPIGRLKTVLVHDRIRRRPEEGSQHTETVGLDGGVLLVHTNG